jgi:WD40 repeat protein
MGHAGAVHSVSFSPNGKYVVSGSEDKTASVWDVTTEKKISQTIHDGAVTVVTFSPDGKYVASGSEDGIVRLWNPITGKEITHLRLDSRVSGASFVPNGKYLVASGIYDKTLHVLEMSTGKEISFLPQSPLNYEDDSWIIVYLSPDSRYLASVDINNPNSAIIWEIATGQEVSRIAQEGIRLISFSPDSQYVVSGDSDRTVRLWETATGKEIRTLTHDRVVESVVFSPDGKYVASGSVDKTARLWDVTTGKEMARLTTDDIIQRLTFSKDGKYIVSASLYGTIRVWAWRADDLIFTACEVMPRNLTRAEWEQFIGDAMPYPSKQEDATCPNLPLEPKITPTPIGTP